MHFGGRLPNRHDGRVVRRMITVRCFSGIRQIGKLLSSLTFEPGSILHLDHLTRLAEK